MPISKAGGARRGWAAALSRPPAAERGGHMTMPRRSLYASRNLLYRAC